MGYLGVLLLAIFVCFVVVQVGPFALQLTGMEPHAAKFRALSAFTGTGFTTAEAERVVRHKGRRGIVSVLMMLGGAGLITIVATMVVAFSKAEGYRGFLTHIGLVILTVFVLYIIVIYSGLGNRLIGWLRKPLTKWLLTEAPELECIFDSGRGWSVNLIVTRQNSRNVGKSLADVGAGKDLAILGIGRSDAFVAQPDSHERLQEGDRLLVYGTDEAAKLLAD
jgi:hypothetical protein